MDSYLSRLSLNGNTLAGKVAKLFAPNLKRRVHRRCLHICTHKAIYNRENLFYGGNIITLGQGLAGHVLGIGSTTEQKGGDIMLIRGEHKLACLNSPLDQHRQNTCCHRIKSTCVPRL